MQGVVRRQYRGPASAYGRSRCGLEAHPAYAARSPSCADARASATLTTAVAAGLRSPPTTAVPEHRVAPTQPGRTVRDAPALRSRDGPQSAPVRPRRARRCPTVIASCDQLRRTCRRSHRVAPLPRFKLSCARRIAGLADDPFIAHGPALERMPSRTDCGTLTSSRRGSSFINGVNMTGDPFSENFCAVPLSYAM